MNEEVPNADLNRRLLAVGLTSQIQLHVTTRSCHAYQTYAKLPTHGIVELVVGQMKVAVVFKR